ncbi:putative colanic acid biosynthesis acetyltransferase WcaF [Sphingomonas sp. NFR15]|nr:putative colanic acid biosynthesis acetyltransferase WcaF [Sphingomonas sp. NFR15]
MGSTSEWGVDMVDERLHQAPRDRTEQSFEFPETVVQPLDARTSGSMHTGAASFSLRNKLERVVWQLTWLTLARWTPPPLHKWRCMLLRMFGARIGGNVRVYGSVEIWHPANLVMEDQAWLGPHVRCYNQGKITIGSRAVVSQYAYLCASSHDVSDPLFQLILKPIVIGEHAWIAADAFVGPGVTVGTGAVLGARGVAVRNLDAWTIYGGNPAKAIKRRTFSEA